MGLRAHVGAEEKPVARMVVYTTLAGLVEIGRLAGEGRGRQAGDHANF
jgi:hypothetical protein